MNERRQGQIITFYSYKGGTGRTMAVANTACLLARRVAEKTGLKRPGVVAIDWDFEAPGLHRFFQPYLRSSETNNLDNTPGCLDLFIKLHQNCAAYKPNDYVGNRKRAYDALVETNFDDFLIETTIPGLAIMPAGRFDDSYAKNVSQFSWDEFFQSTLGLFAGFTDFIRHRFDYALVDSRTGITDTSGICTMLLPDKLVVVFTPSQQSFTGIEELVRRAVTYRKSSPDGRSLSVFPLPSRIEMARPELFEIWRGRSRSKGGSEQVQSSSPELGYQPLFEELFQEVYALDDIDLTDFFDEVQLQHVPDYAYGEPIAVELEASKSRIFLRRSYEAFVERLEELNAPWESLIDVREERVVVERCEEARAKIEQGDINEALRIADMLTLRKPPSTTYDQVADTLIAIARKAFPISRDATSNLIRSAAEIALTYRDIDPALLADSLRETGELCLSFGDYDNARFMFQESRTTAVKSLGEAHPVTISASAGLGEALRLLGLYSEAQLLQEQALEGAQRTLGEEHPDTLKTMYRLAETLSAQGLYNKAESLQRQSLESYEKVLGAERPEIAIGLNNLAVTLYGQGRVDEAETLYREAIEIQEKTLGCDDPATAVSLNNLAAAIHNQGRLGESESLYRRALEIRENMLGCDHPQTAETLNGLALTLHSMDRLGEAESLIRRALEIRKKTLGRDHPVTAVTLNDLGTTLYEQGRFSEAESLQRRVFEIAKARSDQARIMSACQSLGMVAIALENHTEAQEWARKLLTTSEEMGNRRGMANAYAQLGVATQALGEYEEAQTWARKSLATSEELCDRRGIADSYIQLSVAAQALDDYEEAQACALKSLTTFEELGDRQGMAKSYTQLSVAAHALDDYEQAGGQARKSLAISEELGNRVGMADSYSQLGAAMHALGELEQALEMYKRSLAINEALDRDEGVASAYGNLAKVYQTLGNVDQANEMIRQEQRLQQQLDRAVPPDKLDPQLDQQTRGLPESRIMYVELKTGHAHNGPASIGRVFQSKTGKTLTYKGKTFHRTRGTAGSGNYVDVKTSDMYWITGVKKRQDDRHPDGLGRVEIDDDVLEDYLELIGEGVTGTTRDKPETHRRGRNPAKR